MGEEVVLRNSVYASEKGWGSQVGSGLCRRRGILEQGERDVCGETMEDKAGDGPGCLGHDRAGGKGGGERPNLPHLSGSSGGLEAVTTMDQQRAPVQRVRHLSLKTDEAEPSATSTCSGERSSTQPYLHVP